MALGRILLLLSAIGAHILPCEAFQGASSPHFPKGTTPRCAAASEHPHELRRLEEPPPLSQPVYSLATLNPDSTTNMNIVTYATSVAISPSRIYAVSLYKGTLSHSNFLERRWGILQLMKQSHAGLVNVLGKQSGRDTDKRLGCACEGFTWTEHSEVESPRPIMLLPDSAAYLTLELISKHDVGDHDIALCKLAHVSGMMGAYEDVLEDVLYTEHLRRAGILSSAPPALADRAAKFRREAAGQ